MKVSGGAKAIPVDQMKCNILKAKMEEENKKGIKYYSISSVVFIFIDVSFEILSFFNYLEM